MSAPAWLRLPVPHVSTKLLKSSLSLHAKILSYIWNERIKYCKRYYEVNRSVLCTCKLLMSVYLDIKLLYPHLKVNCNVLMCKICIAWRLVVNIFLWCNANFVPFPRGTLVVRQMGNGRITMIMTEIIKMPPWFINCSICWYGFCMYFIDTDNLIYSITFNYQVIRTSWKCDGQPNISDRLSSGQQVFFRMSYAAFTYLPI